VVDGCSLPQTLVRVVFPVAAPGIAATAIFALILCWNEFMFALVLTSVDARTIPLGITAFLSERGILWGEMFAAIVIASGAARAVRRRRPAAHGPRHRWRGHQGLGK